MFAGVVQDDAENNLFPGISAEVKGIVNYYGSCSVMNEDSNPIQILLCQPDSPEGMVMGHVDLRDNLELKKKLSVVISCRNAFNNVACRGGCAGIPV